MKFLTTVDTLMNDYGYVVYIFAIIVVLFLVAIAFMYVALKRSKSEEGALKSFPFEKVKILTDNERKLYNNLLPVCTEMDLSVYPKVRVADIVTVKKGTKDYMKFFNQIKAKHVDFALCDKELDVKLLIELDDVTHAQRKRVERDELIDKIYDAAGLKILHISSSNDKDLTAKIRNAVFPDNKEENIASPIK